MSCYLDLISLSIESLFKTFSFLVMEANYPDFNLVVGCLLLWLSNFAQRLMFG